MIHQLHREQQLSCDITTAWNFFSSPHNLSQITPANMRFSVISKDLPVSIYEGMIIDYNIYPLLEIKMFWRTKITQVDFEKSFTDFQEKGPYRYWNHFHEFIPNNEGVLMKDTVKYELPFGLLGAIAHKTIVKQKLDNIFNYRYRILEQLFNTNL